MKNDKNVASDGQEYGRNYWVQVCWIAVLFGLFYTLVTMPMAVNIVILAICAIVLGVYAYRKHKK